MMKKPMLEQEYVYTVNNTGEYRSVLVTLEVTGESEVLTIKSKNPESMTLEELDRVLIGFEEDVLSKMKMSIQDSYEVRLDQGGNLYKVNFQYHRTVKSLLGISPSQHMEK